eukprot:142904_1
MFFVTNAIALLCVINWIVDCCCWVNMMKEHSEIEIVFIRIPSCVAALVPTLQLTCNDYQIMSVSTLPFSLNCIVHLYVGNVSLYRVLPSVLLTFTNFKYICWN